MNREAAGMMRDVLARKTTESDVILFYLISLYLILYCHVTRSPMKSHISARTAPTGSDEQIDNVWADIAHVSLGDRCLKHV